MNHERKQVRKARAKARLAVCCWADGGFGDQNRILQEQVRKVLGKDLGDVVRLYPLAVRKDGRKNVWDMEVLEGCLGLDDPATMLGSLTPTDPSAWVGLFEKEAKEGCSAGEENLIRTALLRMMVPTFGSFKLPADPWAARWALYRENLLRRKV